MEQNQTERHLPMYNMKVVAQETGLNPRTIRTWERRYALPRPPRATGGHRLYSQYDIDLLKWLLARQAEGASIRNAVELWRTLAAKGEDPLLHPAPAKAVALSLPKAIQDAAEDAIEDIVQGSIWIARIYYPNRRCHLWCSNLYSAPDPCNP
jgi:DNA-binding transcriptional MerR regulator